MTDHAQYRLLGQTVDDAAGEAFDKVGRLLGLPYPGGPAIMQAAAGAEHMDRVFPRAWLGDSFDFSFSGLKTAARREVASELGIDVRTMSSEAQPLPDGGRGRAGLRLPGVSRRRACREDPARGRGEWRAHDRGRRGSGRELACSAARIEHNAASARHPRRRAAARAVHRQRGDDRRCRLLPCPRRRAAPDPIWPPNHHSSWLWPTTAPPEPRGHRGRACHSPSVRPLGMSLYVTNGPRLL